MTYMAWYMQVLPMNRQELRTTAFQVADINRTARETRGGRQHDVVWCVTCN
jgi:hypothetical protein